MEYFGDDRENPDFMGNRNRVELLAPAGSAEGFYGAIHGGADAVYLAGNRFGARAYAENFTKETLLECIHYGHLLGKKLYLTVNTLLKEAEFDELYAYLQPFYEAEMDAVIVQDLGVFRLIRKHFPGWKLHVSTQMTLCSGYGASLLKEMGASRIVPARELSLQELILMKQQADIELETFIHGAMCYCYSGQCLFSSILGGRSGNRGRCAQPCRQSYTVTAGSVKQEACYPLSLRDLCTIEHLPRLIEAGIDSFKIEGRMKKPEYAAGVTAVYRHYIDQYYALRESLGPEKAAEAYQLEMKKMRSEGGKATDWKILNSFYIRSGVGDGYYFKHNGREMITMESPSYSENDEQLFSDIRKKYITTRQLLPVTVTAFFGVGQPAVLILQWQDISVRVEGTVVEQAQKQPITEANVVKQLGRLGDSTFYAAEMRITVEENAFYPLKQMNELRREAVARLEEQILKAYGYLGRVSGDWENRRSEDGNTGNFPEKLRTQAQWAFSVHTKAQLEAVTEWILAKCMEISIRIYVEGDLIVQHWTAVSALCRKLSEHCTIYVALPYILRETEHRYLELLFERVEHSRLFQGVLVRSMDGMGYLHQRGKGITCRTDAGVYVWNLSAVYALCAMQRVGSEGVLVEGFCLPYELKASEQRKLLGKLPCEKIVYSRIPMMITANCLYRTTGQCKKGTEKGSCPDTAKPSAMLRDRYHMNFPVDINCLHCMNIIYNSVPFSLYQEILKWKEQVDLRMDFTIESAEETEQLLNLFLCGKPLPQKEYHTTTGHEKRGVE